ncbi:ferric reductase-like transmembrane domain-containing protein [Tropicimonas sp. TH_r6]|uniref:sulfite oxidase heme-binding subunit YedZ n=1 Tax=Tropicimonas sp. TH_r6 TaxID=3082085 RepID=UPI0029558AB2|nr:ferric reductase-like transmembrane domain-containing protein [Tropicimonas sp. TH_r6]MDV7145146.1 ferric reductase-like transmembrane domain-containing protein [Tropicimonas sp. TH_r6]
MLKRFFPYLLWSLLALPALGMLSELISSSDPRISHQLLHPTGEFAARFMIIAMMATPLTLLLPGWRGPRWMVKNRRYFGVAAFGYAALHTIFYVIDKGVLERILQQATHFDMWTGWLAFFIFIPLAATSYNGAIRRLGPKAWKSLQRWTYPAAVLTLLHWAALHNWEHPAAAIVHFAPLALLECYRIWWNLNRARTVPA